MTQPPDTQALLAELAALRTRLAEAEDTLDAIRQGRVDAVVVQGPQGEQIFTLQGADQPYRLMIEAMQEGAVTLTADGTILFSNQSFATLIQTPLEQVVGANIQQFIATANQEQLTLLLEQGVAGRSAGELHLTSSEGARIPVLLALTSLRAYDVPAACVVVTDLSDQKRYLELHAAQQALQVSEARYRTIFETAGVALWEEDFSQVQTLLASLQAQGVRDFRQYMADHPTFVRQAIEAVKILDVNTTAMRMFGATRKEELFASLHAIFAPQTEAIFVEEMMALVEGRQFFQGETTMQTLQGQPLNVMFSMTFPPPGALIDRVIVSILDVTSRKHAEAERERLLAEFQRVNAELQQFVYIVSHDLNEPLRTMRNYVQLLAREAAGVLEDSASEYMVFISDAAERMQQMLAALLDYTQAGRPPEFETVDCEALLAQVENDLQMIIVERNAVVTHDPLPLVTGNAARLKQVFQNLIGNALKFRSEAPPRIHLSAQREGRHWRFSVRDNGIGIAPKQIDRLFRVFQRLHTRQEYAGTGIGLAICRKIIEQHQGRIWVESESGKGATFYFTLMSGAWPETLDASSQRGKRDDQAAFPPATNLPS